MPREISEATYSLIFAALKHPLRRRILRMLSVKPLSYTEMMDSLSVSTGHLNYFIGSLGELISKNQEGKYRLSTLGVAALNLLKEVEEPPSTSSNNRKETKFFVSYSVIACIVLLSLGAYCLTYAKWDLTPWPQLHEIWAGEIRLRLEPNQSLTVNYTITYNGNGEKYGAPNGSFLFYDRADGPPANSLERYEVDSAGYYIHRIGGNATIQLRVFSPSDKLLNEYVDRNLESVLIVVISGNETVENITFGNVTYRKLAIQGGNIYQIIAGLPQSWTVDEPGTYRIVITNLSPTEPVEFTGSFQFTRNYFYRPYAKFGYVTFSLGLGLPIVFLINLAYNKLRRPESR